MVSVNTNIREKTHLLVSVIGNNLIHQYIELRHDTSSIREGIAIDADADFSFASITRISSELHIVRRNTLDNRITLRSQSSATFRKKLKPLQMLRISLS